MGAGVLQPVITQHTQVATVGIDRLRANVDRGGRAMRHPGGPEVREAVKLDRLLCRLGTRIGG